MFSAPLSIGHEEQAAAVGAPHRPVVLGAAIDELLVARRREPAHDPDFGLVQMRVALAPPLARAVAARAERDRLPVGRRRGGELVREAIGGHRHRHAAGGADAIDVVAGDLARARRVVDPLSVARPAIQQLVAVVERQPAQVAGRERQQVDVAAARAVGDERQRPAVGRVARAAIRSPACETSSRASPPASGTVQRSPPDANAISDRSGRDRRLGEIRPRIRRRRGRLLRRGHAGKRRNAQTHTGGDGQANREFMREIMNRRGHGISRQMRLWQ